MISHFRDAGSARRGLKHGGGSGDAEVGDGTESPYHLTGDRLAVQMSPTGSPEVTAGVIHVYCGRPRAV